MVFNILFLIFDFQGVLSDSEARPYDLHALSTPPAFILDQDQILINRSGLMRITTRIYADKISAFFRVLAKRAFRVFPRVLTKVKTNSEQL